MNKPHPLFSVCLLLFNFLLIPSITQTKPLLDYTQIKKQYLKNFESSLQDPASKQLTEHNKRQIVFKLFCSLNQEHDSYAHINYDSESFLLFENLFDDLAILYNPKSSKTLFSTINRTTTVFGEVILTHILANPLRIAHELTKRQQFIQELVTNQDLYDQIKKIVLHLKSIEPSVLSLLGKKTIFSPQINRLFFSFPLFKSFNNNAYSLDIGNRYIPFLQFLHTQIIPIISLSYTGMLVNLGDSIQSISWFAVIKEFCICLKKVVTSKTLVISSFLGTLYQIHSISKNTQDRIEILTQAQESLVDLKNLYKISKKAHTLISKNSIIRSNIQSYDALKKLSEPNSPANTLKQFLTSQSFKEKKLSYLPPQIGHILLAYKLIKPACISLSEALYALGQLDAYLSIATLYKEFQSQRVQFCFPTYYEQNTPLLEIKNLWNPFIDSQKVITNNVMFGIPHPMRTMILTGVNKGGKSTFMKATTLNIYLAQTICIAPSKKMTFTPFARLGTTANVCEIPDGDSSFQAEARRAKDLLSITQKNNSQEHSFNIFDEWGKTTNPQDGAAACYKYVKKINSEQNAINIFATHLIDVTKAELYIDSCKNYKFQISPDGTYSYKLMPGINSISNAETILIEIFKTVDPNLFKNLRSPEK